MLTAAVTLLLAQTQPISYIDRSLSAHRNLKAANVSITVFRSEAAGKKTTESFQLAFVRPNEVRLRMQTKASGDQRATDRVFAIVGNRLTAYDATAGERLQKTLQGSGTLADRLIAVLGPLNDGVQAILEPARMAAVLDPFKALKGWTVSKESADVVLVRRMNSANSVMLRFDAKTLLVKKVFFLASGNTMEWTYTYGPKPTTVAFRPPSTAILVDEFVNRVAPPRYADAAARRAGETALNAMNRLRAAEFTITGNDGLNSKVSYTSGMVREELRGRAWAYDGSVLTASIDATKRHFSSKKGRNSSIDSLGDISMYGSPFVRALLQKRNPLFALLWQGYTVRIVGEMTIGGAKCTILEAKAMEIRNTISIRASDGLPVMIRTENKEPGSSHTIVSQIDIKYSSVGKPLPASKFKIGVKAGFKSGPFPTRKQA